jgi:transposase InsO family protein
MKDPKPGAYQQALARQRAQLIMQVRSGLLSAQEAARQLGVSRKTYYKWERRALAAMVEALGNREHGHPPLASDPEKEALRRQTQELQAKLQVFEQTARIRQALEQPDKKKNEVAEMVVTTLAQLKPQVRWPYQRLCASVGLPYASFRRWKHRLACGRSALLQPGPKKVAALNLHELRGHVCCLNHARQRSRGVGQLYRQYQSQISRRDLEVLTETVRRELLQRHQAELRPLTWPVPGLVWSLDDAELARLADHNLHLHQVQDLASRYKFTPLVGGQVLGETVALHLEQLFLQHGPPLVLKRDNGSNLNHQAVEEVLARYLVMPLNSPPHYPPYNGGMEWAVRELKTPLVEKLLAHGPIPESQVQVGAELLAHDLNHRSRPCLQGQVPCRVFQDAKPALKAYTLRKRREIFDWINELTQTLIEVSAAHTQRQAATARRLAVETWLQRNGVITITQNQKVLPIFPEKTAHN